MNEPVDLCDEVDLTPELVGCCDAVAGQIVATLLDCDYDEQWCQKSSEINKPIYNMARAIIAQVREEMKTHAEVRSVNHDGSAVANIGSLCGGILDNG